MKIRLHGTLDEVEKSKEILQKSFDIVSISKPYPDRGESKLVRVYVEVRL